MTPWSGWRQRSSASTPGEKPVRGAHDGLIGQVEVPLGQRGAEVVLELVAVLGLFGRP